MTLSRYPMLAAIAATCLSFIQAQTSAPSTAPGVPSTAPAPSVTPEGDYSGALRPQVHFSPPVGFMNDPNGLFKSSNGTWHLYYQYNPTDVVAGNQHWGHATSDDLYHWVNHPIALYPPNNQSGVFSGSAVVDANNTSGMFNDTTDGVVAIYTLNTPQEQTQNVAFSYDGGYTFTEYTGNPVLSRNSTQFRDPKVFWYDDHWVMVVAFSVDFTIGIYTSPDLLDWSFASNFSHAGLLGLQYECPGLERLPIETFEGEKGQGYAWMLYISINPGAPLGGSIGEYFVGDFNGTHFEAYDAAARIADWGKDNYATQFWYAPDEDPTSIAWASNWQYTNRVPTADEGFRSIMSLPRHNYLTNATRIGWVLGSRPVYLGPVLESQLASSDNLINDTLSVDYTNVTSNAIYFQINLTYPSPLPTLAATASLNFTFSSSKSGENVTGGYLLAGENAGAIWLDRGNTDGFRDAFFTDKFSLTQATPLFARQIEGVIDRTVLELFLDGGHFSSTSLFYPKEMLDRMEVVTAGLVDGVDVSVAVWGLKSGWQ